jgi:hypothetical protein
MWSNACFHFLTWLSIYLGLTRSPIFAYTNSPNSQSHACTTNSTEEKILVHFCWFFDQFSDYFSIIIHNYIYNIYTNTKTCVLWIQKKKSFDFSFCVPPLFRNLGQRFAERKVLKKKKTSGHTPTPWRFSVHVIFIYI